MKKNLQEEEKYIHLKIEEKKIDAVSSPKLKQIFLETEHKNNWILDLSQVKYIDSSALSAILVGNKTSKASNNEFVLIGLSDHALKLIKISKLNEVLTILPTLQEGIDFIFMSELEKEMQQELK